MWLHNHQKKKQYQTNKKDHRGGQWDLISSEPEQKDCIEIPETLMYLKMKYERFLQWNTMFFSSKNSRPPTFWILPKLCVFCKNCGSNPVQIFQWNSFEHWRTIYLSICYFAPVISQRYIKYTLLHSSKRSVYLWPCSIYLTLFKNCHL